MGTLDDIRSQFGEVTLSAREVKHNWADLCVCGHLDRYHSPTVGGAYPVLPDENVTTHSGLTVTRKHLFHGCVGALKRRDQEHVTFDPSAGPGLQTFTINPTCPCTELRPAAKVDRPNRYFNQQVPRSATVVDQTRHPFMVGISAFYTHLSRRRAATADPTWADAEFERRFVWIEETRRCSISTCRSTVPTDVWPTFVNGEQLSELRCGLHR